MPTRRRSPAKRVPPAEGAVQIKVTMKHIKPPIWRRLVVPDHFTLGGLHELIQTAMGWDGYHMHAFRVGDRHYGSASYDLRELEMDDEETVSLRNVADRPKRKLHYEYDFGDGWEHEILVEKITPLDPLKRYPVCLAGARACPPEDCGGTPGYYGVLDALRDPANPEHAELLEWLGDTYDPEHFDVDAINKRLTGK